MEPVRLSELAAEYGGTKEGSADPEISGVASVEDAGPGDLTFVARKEMLAKLSETRAAAVVLGPGVECDLPVLRVDDPYAAFARILERFDMALDRIFPPGKHPTAVVADTAEIGDAVAIGPFAVVGDGVRLGAGCRLGPHVVIEAETTLGEQCRIEANVTICHGSVLGDRVIVHAGAAIGTDGFGYLPGPTGLNKIPQVGIVVLGDDVEIGANACVDRATTGRTVIGAGSKIDNQVQIGHNVVVGRNCAISAQTGISGSCCVGDQVTMGGQVGIGDHLSVGDGVKIGAKSGLARDIPAGQTVFGYPAFEFSEAFRMVAALRRLPETLKRIVKLEQAVSRLDRDEGD